jgi:penicillin-binding protein 2
MYLQSPPPRPEPEPDPNQLVLRAAALGVVALLLFGVLVFRLWALQVLKSDQYATAALQNDVRQVPLPAPRGKIVDRTGVVLVENTQGVQAQVDPAGLPSSIDCAKLRQPGAVARCTTLMAETPPGAAPRCGDLHQQPRCDVLFRLGRVLGMKKPKSAWGIYEKRLLVKADGSGGCTAKDGRCYVVNAGAAVAIKNADADQVSYIMERRGLFPGVQFMQTYQRSYPVDRLAPNVLGYVARFTDRNMKDEKFAGLRADSMVGQAGVEYEYDRQLRGADGELTQSYDASGRATGQPYLTAAPQPGSTLQLTLDSRLQDAAQQAIDYGVQVARNDHQWRASYGAIVAMNPNTGEIYAMASTPTYSPNIWVPPYKGQDRVLDTNNRGKPLVDKAYQGFYGYPPGSTFKPITAAAAWNERMLSSGSTRDCSGSFSLSNDTSGQVFNNWEPTEHGQIGLPRALEISCDTFFYRLGYEFYQRGNDGNDFQKQIRRFGFGTQPPIDLPGATSGLVPDAAWRVQVNPPDDPQAQAWNPGYDIQMAIGQGDLGVSPLQLATAYSAIANGGKLPTPHVGSALLDVEGNVIQRFRPGPQRDLNLSPALVQSLKDGLWRAAHGADGTSTGVFGNFSPTVYGKTGTAETRLPNVSHAWYAGFAGKGKNAIVVVALIENGGHGGVAAAPAARKVFQAWFHPDEKNPNLVGTDVSN